MNKSVKRYGNCIARLPSQDLDQAVEIRDFCLETMPIISCKRFLTQLNSYCDWALGSGLIKTNPFQGMARKIRLPKSANTDDVDPFSVEEREKIIQALKRSDFTKTRKVKRHHQFNHSYYASYVE